jgi:hypothetical protein
MLLLQLLLLLTKAATAASTTLLLTSPSPNALRIFSICSCLRCATACVSLLMLHRQADRQAAGGWRGGRNQVSICSMALLALLQHAQKHECMQTSSLEALSPKA